LGDHTGNSGQQGNITTVFGIQVIIRYDPDHVDDITWYLYRVNATAITGNLLLLRVDTRGINTIDKA
jgi:hypothetical protein